MEELSIAHKLAMIDGGSELPEDHQSVRQFDEILDTLHEQCAQSRQQMADMSVFAYQEYGDEYGLTLYDIMSGVSERIANGYHTMGEANFAMELAAFLE